MCDSGEVSWHNQPFFCASFHAHNLGDVTVCWQVHLPSLTLSKLTVNPRIFCVTSLFWSRFQIMSQGDNHNLMWCLYWWLFYMPPSLCVESSHSAAGPTFPSTSSSTCCVFVSGPLSGFDPEMFCGTLTPPPSLPPILLQSRHPHQHVSGAVWVSIYATSNSTSSPDWNAF